MERASDYRIISIDGSKIYRKKYNFEQPGQGLNVRDKKENLIEDMFAGYLSRSLDTEKLIEIFLDHPRQLNHGEHKYNDYRQVILSEENPIMPLLIDVYFEHACREFNCFPSEQGVRYIRFGYELRETDWGKNHLVTRIVKGKEQIVGVEVVEKEKDDTDGNDGNDTDDGSGENSKQSKSGSRKKKKYYDKVAKDQLPDFVDLDFIDKNNKNKKNKDKKDETAKITDYIKFENGKYYKKSKDFPYVNDKDYQEMSAENIRRYLYDKGFDCDGIHFVRYKRSAGSSRDGHCLFIAEPLKKKMMEWTRCGLPDEAITGDVVSWEAYSALTLSDLKWPLALSRKSILIMRDQFDSFEEPVICVSDKEKENCTDRELDAAEKICKIENTIWDGEGLLDASCFAGLANDYPYSAEEPGNRFDRCGMVLLRNRFFKTCAFRTKLQDWFHDNDITDVSQLAGYTEATDIHDIKLVVTESSVKYFKLCGIDEKSSEDEFMKTAQLYLGSLFGKDAASVFGIVKTDKPTHFMDGDMVCTNYQVLSTIGLTQDEVHKLYEPSESYFVHIKNEPMYMRHYLNQFAGDTLYCDDSESDDVGGDGWGDADSDENGALSSDGYTSKAVMELLKYSDDFSGTPYYKKFLHSFVNAFRNRIRGGRILVNGTYATLLGNGAELLYALINKDYRSDRSAFLEKDQIYTPKFKPDTKLICARSPHVTMGNLLLSVNTKCEIYEKYFELSPEIVCVNAIGNNIQNRLNGCDYDSDTMLITDNALLVNAAERTYSEFLVPFCPLKPDKRTGVDVAVVDNDIANNQVGAIMNLSQYLNAKYWDIRESNPDGARELYKKICMLAIMSGMEIDKAKRQYKVNVTDELKRLSGEEKTNKPKFYAFVTGGNTKKADNIKMRATMSYVYDECAKIDRAVSKSVVRLQDLVRFPNGIVSGNDSRYAKYVRGAVDKYKKTTDYIRSKRHSPNGRKAEDLRKWKQDAFEKCKSAVAQYLKNDIVLLSLLKDLDGKGKNHDVSGYHMYLFAFVALDEHKLFIRRIIRGKRCLQDLIRDEAHGTVDIYGHKFSVNTKRFRCKKRKLVPKKGSTIPVN